MKKQLLLIGIALTLMSGLSFVGAQDSSFDIVLSFDNLEAPGDDHYEGWVIEDGSPVSTGKFTIDSTGQITDLDGNSISEFAVNADLELVTTFVLSLEPSGDTDSIPAAIKPLAGDFDSDKSTATLSHNIGADFSSISGSYILATPTNGADTDENSGIWWLDPTGDAPVAGLDLPDLTGTDWTYEGWVVIDGTPVTTGTFDMVSQVDLDDSFSGNEAGPPFPGEDFLVNAPAGLTFPVDLSEMTAVISIEPRQDNSPSPFMFKPLVGMIPASAMDHTVYDMDDMSSTLTTGTVTVQSSNSPLPLPNVISFIMMLSLVTLVAKSFRKRN